MPLAIITGASRGLGLALARALAREGWGLVLDARGSAELAAAADELGAVTDVVALAGDVAQPAHRGELVRAAGDRVDLLVNNASLLGPSPQPALGAYPIGELERLYRANVFAPLALTQLVLPRLPDGAAVLNVTSDAAVEPYAGGVDTAPRRRRSSSSQRSLRPSIRRCTSMPSIPATCARGCIRTPSPGRTSPTVPSPRRASRGCWR